MLLMMPLPCRRLPTYKALCSLSCFYISWLHVAHGAIAVQEVANLQGLVVIDVVEGTAMSSLPHMMNVLQQRPSSFSTLQTAVHWARKSGKPLMYGVNLMCVCP